MPESNQEITPEIFDHLVDLAELELDEQDTEYLRRELNNQLSAIHELEAIDLDEDTPPASHGIPYPPDNKPALRGDEWRPSDESKGIAAQAPQLEDGYVIVPDIPHTTLE
jgi:aspartyl-tRNA(Asn)/glutamyl-tRNA(Gln) amidotransferase subunit C